MALSAVLGMLVASACDPDPSTPPTTTTAKPPASCRGTGSIATKDVAYRQVTGVKRNLLSLDYYKPIRPAGCGPAPLVVYVHGGGFSIGDKDNKIADKVRLFTGEGWVFATVNYRLSPSTAGVPNPIRYPTHEQDVAAALAWLKGHASTLGADPSRILFMGHSSGAFIVSLMSTDMAFLAAAGLSAANVRCTASLDTEYDITDQVAQGGSQEQLYRNAFGNDPAIWANGSPIDHTAKGSVRPKFLIFTRGTARRTAQARAFGAALTAGGTSARVLDVSPLQHDEVNEAVGKSGDTKVTGPLMSYFRTCVGPTS